MHIVNLDPAAESFAYTPEVDVRELVTADDMMEMMDLGPNGALEKRSWGLARKNLSFGLNRTELACNLHIFVVLPLISCF